MQIEVWIENVFDTLNLAKYSQNVRGILRVNMQGIRFK